MSRLQRPCVVYLTLFSLMACVALPACAQFSSGPGFGNVFTRKRVELRRKLPPVVNIAGKSVAVTVEAQGVLKTEMQSDLENLLTRSDSNVQVGGSHPDYVIVCNVTMYDAPKLVTTKEGNVTAQNFTGALSVSFRIGEPSNGISSAPAALPDRSISRPVPPTGAAPFTFPSQARPRPRPASQN